MGKTLNRLGQPANGQFSAPTAESLRDRLTRWRYHYWPDHLLGEVLAKRWMETAIPVAVLIIVYHSVMLP